MFYVSYKEIRENVGEITSITHNPPDDLDQSVGRYFPDESMPVMQNIPNMNPYLKLLLNENVLYYDYVALVSYDTKINALEKKYEDLAAESITSQVGLVDTYERLLATELETTNAQVALTDVYEELLAVKDMIAEMKGGEKV